MAEAVLIPLGTALGAPAATAAMTGLTAIGTAFSVVGALSQGQQQSTASNYNAGVAQNNAIASRQQAAANAEAHERKARQQLGSIRAGYGASGVGMEGSPMDVLESSAMMAELDRQNILYGGELRASGYESTAGLELMKGENAVTSSYYNAGSALLIGGAKAGAFSGSSGGTSAGMPRGNNPDEWNNEELRQW